MNYWGRIITGNHDKLCYVMYQCMLKLYNENKFKSQWLDYIKKMLNNSGMSGIWLYQEGLNLNWFKNAFERKVKDQFNSEWVVNLRNKSSCDTYICYKENVVFENYFSALPKQCWISMCKLRTNNHRFPIVTGRYNGTIREQRFCNKCSDNILGDEYHVTFRM